MQACEQGNLQRVQQLVASSDVNDVNNAGYSALALAVKGGHFDIVKLLLAYQADVNQINKVKVMQAGQSVLFLACWHNRLNCVKILLSHGANINACDQRGWTPLIISVYHNYPQTVKLLINAGCKLEHKDCFGKTAMDRVKSVEMASILQKAPNDKKMNDSTVSLRIPRQLSRGVKRSASLRSSKENSLAPSRNLTPPRKQLRSRIAKRESQGSPQIQGWNKQFQESLTKQLIQVEQTRQNSSPTFSHDRKPPVRPKVNRTSPSPNRTPVKERLNDSMASMDLDYNELKVDIIQNINNQVKLIRERVQNNSYEHIQHQLLDAVPKLTRTLEADIGQKVREIAQAMRDKLRQSIQIKVKQRLGSNQQTVFTEVTRPKSAQIPPKPKSRINQKGGDRPPVPVTNVSDTLKSFLKINEANMSM